MISVVIPTHKQEYLKRTLQSLADAGENESYEVIVCENPEITPETRQIVDSMGPNFSLVCSATIGANNARNVGVHFAKGEIIALTDDDCEVDKNWITRIRLALENKDIGCVGGRVQLRLEPEIDLTSMQTGYLTEVNYGRTEFPRKLNRSEYLVSCNLAFTREVYNLVGGFNSNIGYMGKDNFIGNDEVLFVRDCKNHGDVMYDNDLLVYHIVNEYRSSMKYLIRRAYGQGCADVILSKLQEQKFCRNYSINDSDIKSNLILQLANAMGTTNTILGVEPCEQFYLVLEELARN